MKITDLIDPFSRQGPFTRKCARAEMPDKPAPGEGMSYCNAIACRRLVAPTETCELLGKITPAIAQDCHQAGYEDPRYPPDSTVRHFDNTKGAL